TSVAAILEKKDEAERARFPDLTPMLETMQELCAILAAKRKRRGAIDFDLPEAEFQFDRKGAVVSVTPARRTIAHRIIEEFMLLANESVAETLAASGGPAIYRVHEKPDTAKAEDFAEFARCLGYTLNKSGGLYAPGDFQKFIARIEGRTEQKFLVYLMLRSFMQARYSESNIGHFGLATPEYTHFTAPIRRYPDLIVHRLLKRCFDKKASPQWREDMAGRLPEIARHSSARERAAEEAEREIEKIKKAQFMAGKVGEEFEALVYSPSRNGFFVELMDPFVEGFVPVETLTDDHYVYREKSRAIMGRHRGRRFQPGSKIRVRLDRADTETARLTFSVCAGR
ncbi:MAG TPA: RNB domain-containing ribonuclease, partial [Acidobacteriota bacterium]|nr:RNB domain-containing ribonuclease [Acidobacteriota bacterium]